MKPDTDDGLRRALTAYAETTTTAPGAWERLAGTPSTSADGQLDRQRAVGWVRVPPTQLPMPPGASVSPPVPPTSGADAVFDRERVYLRSELVATVVSLPLDRPWVVFDRAGDRDSLDLIAAVSGRGNLLSMVDRVAVDGGSGLIGQRPAPDSNLVPEGVEEVRGVKTTRYRIGVPEGIVATRLWIDGKGLVRRAQISDSDYLDTVELYDFG